MTLSTSLTTGVIFQNVISDESLLKSRIIQEIKTSRVIAVCNSDSKSSFHYKALRSFSRIHDETQGFFYIFKK